MCLKLGISDYFSSRYRKYLLYNFPVLTRIWKYRFPRWEITTSYRAGRTASEAWYGSQLRIRTTWGPARPVDDL